MLRTAGRGLSRVLQRAVAAPVPYQQWHVIQPRAAAAAVLSSPRWLSNASALSAGHGGGELDEFGIATGAEREELEAQRQGKKRFDIDPPRGPFGTKEHPAIVESHYDVRIVGCSGGVGEDEHDVTWFHLEKDQTYECPSAPRCFS